MRFVLWLLFLGFALTPTLSAETEDLKIWSIDTDVNDRFGSSVAISGPLLLVAAHWADSTDVSNLGEVHVFEYDFDIEEWVREQLLVPSTDTDNNYFGAPVVTNGEQIFVGYSLDDEQALDAGSVYVYERDEETSDWVLFDTLFAEDLEVNSRFGGSLACSEDVLVVGSPSHGDAGTAWVFRRDPDTGEFEEECALESSDGLADDFFGIAVAIDHDHGDVLVVGASDDDVFAPNDDGINRGAAYVFRWNATDEEWTQEKKLKASDAARSDHFGSAVAVADGVVVVGAPFKNYTQSDSGGAYVFRYDEATEEWSEEQALLPSDGSGADQAGWNVVTDGEICLISATGKDVGNSTTNEGAVIVFEFDPADGVWNEISELVSSDRDEFEQFGTAIDMDDSHIVVGVPFHDQFTDSNRGAVYLFERTTLIPHTFTYYSSDTALVYDPTTGEGAVSISVLLEEKTPASPPLQVQGFSMSLEHDANVLSHLMAEAGSGLGSMNDSNGPDYFEVDSCDSGVTVGAVFSETSPGDVTIEAEDAVEVVVLVYETLAEEFVDSTSTSTTSLAWLVDVCSAAIPVDNVVVVDEESHAINTNDVTVTIVPANFVRGDCNGSSLVDIADVLRQLSYMFQQGEEPPCLDSCDANDDGILDIADPIRILDGLFGGGDAPPEPYPDCGHDPTEDEIGCEQVQECP